MSASEIWFIVFAAMTLVAALAVVLSQNLVRAALYLVFTFLGVAALYVMLHAEFLFAMQILIYVGAITVLFMFAVFLTQQVMRAKITLSSASRLVGAIAALGLLAFVAQAVIPEVVSALEIAPKVVDQTAVNNTSKLGMALLTKYILTFELVSVILLAALVGAIVIGKEDKTEDDASE